MTDTDKPLTGFQTLLGVKNVVLSELISNILPNPTFRFAPCGAEISCPCRTFCKP
ncbi:hypothetical protein Barb4_00553 [Bacteroidales bacterium Barb4]|nr:hypothetical protein Barb4_00553 [Bacteroidales bacterium Barb4]